MQIPIEAGYVNTTLARGLANRLAREYMGGADSNGRKFCDERTGPKSNRRWLIHMRDGMRASVGDGISGAQIISKRLLVVLGIDVIEDGSVILRRSVFDARKRDCDTKALAVISPHAVQRYIERRSARDGEISLGELRLALADPLLVITAHKVDIHNPLCKDRDFKIATKAGLIVVTRDYSRLVVKTFIAREQLGGDRKRACDQAANEGVFVLMDDFEEGSDAA